MVRTQAASLDRTLAFLKWYVTLLEAVLGRPPGQMLRLAHRLATAA
jgi:hypothetical protein